MDVSKVITDKLFTQCISLCSSEDNQRKLQTHVIDPLIQYFKHKLSTFFILIIILLCFLLVTNLIMIAYCINMRTMIGRTLRIPPSLGGL